MSTGLRPSAATYARLIRAAGVLCRPKSLSALAPRTRSDLAIGKSAATREVVGAMDAIAVTEHIAYDFISRGGKHSRPFITMAAYDAMTGGRALVSDDEIIDGQAPPESDELSWMPLAVKRAALCIETFHKASLVHDDIEDDDAYRYGQPAVHRRFGLPTAINVGDYLIGLGYRLLSRRDEHDAADAIDDSARLDVLDSLAAAHMRLAEGQGAELIWRDNRDRRLSPQDALKIYALKTSPAFEAALYSGVRFAGDATGYKQPIRRFSRSLGVAFQILNDLSDFVGDETNKRIVGGDILGGRPTLLLALAMEKLSAADGERLLQIASHADASSDEQRLDEVKRLYQQADVFEVATEMVQQHRDQAVRTANNIQPDPLRQLLHFLVDVVLESPSRPTPPLFQVDAMPITNPDEVTTP